MTRDEIISGLEREIKSIRREPRGKMLGIFMTADEAEDIIALLKEQETVEPTVSGAEEYDGHGSWWYQCGKCKMPIDYGERFCRWCGMRVKWG